MLRPQPCRHPGRAMMAPISALRMMRRKIARIEGSRAQRVEDRGDARRRDLRIMRHHGGNRRPGHAGPRMIVALRDDRCGVRRARGSGSRPRDHRAGVVGPDHRISKMRPSLTVTTVPSTTSSGSTMRALVKMTVGHAAASAAEVREREVAQDREVAARPRLLKQREARRSPPAGREVQLQVGRVRAPRPSCIS